MAITKQNLKEKEKEKEKKTNNLSLYFNRFSFGTVEKDQKRLASMLLDNMRDVTLPVNWIDQLKERRNRVVKEFKEKRDFSVIDFEATAKSRYLVGTGSPSPYEVGFFFSRNYGLPVIPGTSLKGSFHHFLVEEETESAKIHRWMGTGTEGEEGQKGSLIFLDALPVHSVTLELDLINNHFPEYYGDKKEPPNDIYDPVPVFYMVVAPHTKLRFTVLIQEKISKDEGKEIKESFMQMLAFKGIGAKTAYGYGRFTPS